MWFKYINSFRNLLALLICLLLVLIQPMVTTAATTNAQPAARISFTFDDGYTSAITQAAPTLAKYGIPATNYVITNCVGMTKAPNTCRADSDATYMTWAQIAQLQTTYGWEIGSHSASHPYLATSDPDDQLLPITFAQAQAELTQSRAVLSAHGINAVSFAPPYGDYNMQTLAEIAKHYVSMRGFQDTGYNTWPYNEYLIRDQHIEGNVGVATVKKYIDTAIANKQWLVLTFHDIKTKASKQSYDYQYSTANLNSIAAYVKSKQDAGLIKATTIRDSFVNSDTNLLANPSFNNGITEGWAMDMPGNVIADRLNNGSYPDPTHSIKLTAGAAAVHLYSPAVGVNPSTTYLIKNYSYVQKLSSGELGFYIDEYDVSDNWISGQWKSAHTAVSAADSIISYKPSSASVASASLQIYVSANSGIIAYVDNVRWYIE